MKGILGAIGCIGAKVSGSVAVLSRFELSIQKLTPRREKKEKEKKKKKKRRKKKKKRRKEKKKRKKLPQIYQGKYSREE